VVEVMGRRTAVDFAWFLGPLLDKTDPGAAD
jgi:hypothetical protein